ncbi:MAG: 4'-phosphopantetheinyl transferase family protein [Symbiopectobacterium sp.]|uniref:4'-phosphopantetheinyl transferase family protein n=1 Tax=Symbiopectobacterium sp. TaxID=2952789 RepID=UPI0039E823B2
MTISAFIGNIEWMTLPLPNGEAVYPGFCAYCRFNPEAYHDTLYHRINVPLSAELARSVLKRSAEFLAGRYLARHVLEKLGINQFTLLSGEDRSPVWPENLCGSLSHNKDSVLCAIHRHSDMYRGVGVDVETLMSDDRAASLWPGIIDEEELQWLQRLDMPFCQALTLSFSAKESLFKAIYPMVQHYFDFLDAQITVLNQAQQVFELQLQTTLNLEFPAGRRFRGAYRMMADKVTTFLCLESPDIV